MLEELFGVSYARVLPVLVFAREPIHLREVARRSGIAPIQASRLLDKLARVGLVEERKSGGGLRLFRFRKETTVGHLICQLVEETRGVLQALRNILEKEKTIEKAFVYGSFASGQEGIKSDVDLIIIGEPDWASLSRRITAVETGFGREVNYSIYSPAEFENRKASPFLSRVLKGKKIFLVGHDGVK